MPLMTNLQILTSAWASLSEAQQDYLFNLALFAIAFDVGPRVWQFNRVLVPHIIGAMG